MTGLPTAVAEQPPAHRPGQPRLIDRVRLALRTRRLSQQRRHHFDESALQRVVRVAVQEVGIAKPAGCHTFRHSVATHLAEDEYDIRIVQEPLGHRDVRTRMIDSHVLNRGGLGVRSPVGGPASARSAAAGPAGIS